MVCFLGLVLIVLGFMGTQAILSKDQVNTKGITVANATQQAERKPVPQLDVKKPTEQAGQASNPQPATNSTTNSTPSTPRPIVTLPPSSKPAPSPPGMPLTVTNFTLTAGSTLCSAGRKQLSYSYAVYYNWPQSGGGTLRAVWEYEVTTGLTSSDPEFPPALVVNVLQGTVQYSDNSGYSGLPIYPWFGYQARLHVTSPNNTYSGWVEIPQGSGSC